MTVSPFMGEPLVHTYEVLAHWDAEASVWWAESHDVPGLVAEAKTYDALVDELRAIVPELLELNMPERSRDRSALRIIAEQTSEISYA